MRIHEDTGLQKKAPGIVARRETSDRRDMELQGQVQRLVVLRALEKPLATKIGGTQNLNER